MIGDDSNFKRKLLTLDHIISYPHIVFKPINCFYTFEISIDP